MKKIVTYFILFISLFLMIENQTNAINNIGEGATLSINVNDGKYLKDDEVFGVENGTVHTYTKKDAETGEIIYCADATRGFFAPEINLGEEQWTYSKKADNSDILAFIFEKGYYKTEGYGATDYLTGIEDTDYFITTMAVWKYTIPGNYLDKLDLTTGKYDGVESEASRKLTKLINDATNTANHKNPSVNIDIDDTKMNLSSDGKYYVSGPIKIEGKDLDTKVSISVSVDGGIPNYYVITDINSISSETSYDVGSTVYVKIEANNISENSNIKVGATATGTKGSVHIWEYSGQGEDVSKIQSIATYTPETVNASDDFNLSISKTDITISKQDITNSKELPGAHLVIKNSAGKIINEWDSTNEPKTLTLDSGTYTLEETISPPGYIKTTEKITFVVNVDNTVSIDNKKVDKVVMTNKPINVTISKTDIVGAAELKGATLRITDKNGNIQSDVYGKKLEWVSTSKPYSFNIKEGTYVLEETIAPDGYIKSTEKITFVVTGDGTVLVNNKKVDKVIMKNEPIIINISKTDIAGSNELPGASLKVTDEEGNVVTDIAGIKLEWVSTEEPSKFHLKAGTYILEETIAPLGYVKSTEKITFIVKEDGKIIIGEEEVSEVVMKNEPIKIIISKQSINDKAELKGAKLRIIGKDNEVVKDINGKLLEWVTDGKVKTIQLAPGTYILEETEAPKGYELSDKKIEFVINEEGKLYVDEKEVKDNKIIFKNTPEPVQVPTGSNYMYIVLSIGIVAIGIVSYFIYNKYKK